MASKVLSACVVFGALAVACITRPVTSENPTTHETITEQVRETAIDKVDLLFAIDNSASMGDKQDLLAAAVPVLVNRLLDPNCVSTTVAACAVASDCTAALGPTAQCNTAGNNGAGQCFVAGDAQGGELQCSTIPSTKPEFAPVHDLHVGIVSSSLGGGGSPDLCVVSGDDPSHFDDKGHLLSRTTTGAVASAQPTDGDGGGFLAWLPSSDPKNANRPAPNVTAYSDESKLVGDFQSLVEGVQQTGCGLEAQLESWYRFLVQPDPWNAIVTTSDSPPRVKYDGVDAELLKMRHDFLRPDSLVAIVQLTDEEDSWSDPLWDGDADSGGFGWVTRTDSFPGGPKDQSGVGPRGTHECDTNPSDPDCQSCAFNGNKPVSKQPIGDDPNCTSCIAGTSCQPGWWTPATPTTPIAAADGVNVRYGAQTMKRRYGFDNQHAIQRYVDGLRSATVPDRAHESHDPASYDPVRNCTNPLFAAALPDGTDTSSGALCNLTPGPRTQDLVFYALIGGVPNDLVQRRELGASDWIKILGKDPDHGDVTGIDPRMIESTAPRAGLPAPSGSYTDDAREWNTLTSSAHIDLQYACTFDLPKPRPCAGDSCDCSGLAATAPDGPPLCDPNARTTQIKGKAYPTIRELRVAKALGAQAVVASLCASVVTGDTSDAAYGYNPAMQAIVDRLAGALALTCLPHPLVKAADGSVPCSLLAVYSAQTDQAAGCTDPGMCNPADPTSCGCAADDAACAASYQGILSRYRAQNGDAGAAPVVCVYKQLPAGPCAGSPDDGWCYVEHTATCAQAIEFGGSGPPVGTTVDLECIE